MTDADGADAPRPRPGRIVEVRLEEQQRIRLSPILEHERRQALFDLLQGNSFTLPNDDGGEYTLALSCEEHSLRFVVQSVDGAERASFKVPLAALLRIIKDYFLICDSYIQAIKTLPPSRIEAIDMGRRGLHDEGATLLRERVAAHAQMDHGTARRLFTLICVLHIRL